MFVCSSKINADDEVVYYCDGGKIAAAELISVTFCLHDINTCVNYRAARSSREYLLGNR